MSSAAAGFILAVGSIAVTLIGIGVIEGIIYLWRSYAAAHIRSEEK